MTTARARPGTTSCTVGDERKFRLGIERSSDAVFVTAPDGAITYVNPAFERLYGFTSAEAIGKTPRILKSGHQPPEFYLRFWSTLLGKQVADVHVVNRTKDGRLVNIESSVNPILDDDGRLVGFLAIHRDVTERIRLEEQLRQAQKMDAMGRLAGGVAHDFNNLLSVVLSYAELAADGIAPGDPLTEDLAEISRAARRASELTAQLLAFGRRQLLQPRIVDLRTCVENMRKMLRRVLREDIELTVEAGEGLWDVKVDVGQVEQILMNLVINARDAMPRGGHLRIETRNVELDREYARCHPCSSAGPHVVLAVSDDGVGMDAGTRARIFEPFFTTKALGKGTGLGLSTVFGIVQQSGGSIDVESHPGRGTTFRIYFPSAVEPEAAPRSGAPAPARARAGAETILVVEDDAPMRRLVQEILGRNGYQVIAADTAAVALQLSAHHGGEIHLLLTDVVMPGMSGRELAQRLLEVRPGTRVLLVSGHADEVAASGQAQSEGVHFLSKPITPQVLLRRVQDVLGVQ